MLVEGATSPRFAPTGHLLFVKETTLFAVPFDPGRGQLAGEPASVVEGLMVGVVRQLPPGALRPLGQRDPRLHRGERLRPGRAARAGRSPGERDPAFDPVGDYLVPRVSPDGNRVAYAATNPATGRREVWVGDLRRGTRTRVPFEKGSATDPIFTRDGRCDHLHGGGRGRTLAHLLGTDRRQPGAGRSDPGARTGEPGELPQGVASGRDRSPAPHHRGVGRRRAVASRHGRHGDGPGRAVGRDRAEPVARRAVPRVRVGRVGRARGLRAAPAGHVAWRPGLEDGR